MIRRISTLSPDSPPSHASSPLFPRVRAGKDASKSVSAKLRKTFENQPMKALLITQGDAILLSAFVHRHVTCIRF